MTFYGTWFDALAQSDPDFRIRKRILAQSREKLLAQIKRDDKYGLIGTYYSVFLKIMNMQKGVPLVLLEDSLLGLASFPVMVSPLADKVMEKELVGLLRLLLKKELAEMDFDAEAGISVDEMTEVDAGEYFPNNSRESVNTV